MAFVRLYKSRILIGLNLIIFLKSALLGLTTWSILYVEFYSYNGTKTLAKIDESSFVLTLGNFLTFFIK
jgi:hypothetical protein